MLWNYLNLVVFLQKNNFLSLTIPPTAAGYNGDKPKAHVPESTIALGHVDDEVTDSEKIVIN